MKSRVGTFTISLDCEGLWGMADNVKVTTEGVINQNSLRKAYQKIDAIFDKHQVKSTAAFVTCFASEEDILRANLPTIKEMAKISPIWFKQIINAFEAHRLDGWLGNECFKLMRSAGHEMAWHGTTHHSLSDSANPQVISLEMNLTSILLKELGEKPETVIFPRNQVGNLNLLQSNGFKSYRPIRRANKFSRFTNLIGEFNPYSKADNELPKLEGAWFISSSGQFLNWPAGVRSIVPCELTIARWKSMIQHVVENSGHLHMWFHPHNLITAPKMVESLEKIMEIVGGYMKTKDLLSLTINESKKYYN